MIIGFYINLRQGQGLCNTPFQYRAFLNSVPKGSNILDVGCGNGIFLIKEHAWIIMRIIKL